MKNAKTPLLGYALLGLIHLKPQSGYELRKTFTDTAMGNYSDSPGAIYPALKRLERDADVMSEVQEAGGLRRRRVYRISESGMAKLKAWLREPVAPEDVRRGADELLLRFSFMERVLGATACVEFLRNFASALPPYIEHLESFLAANSTVMPLSARLALENGIRGYRSMHEWSQYALQCFLELEGNQPQQRRTKVRQKGRPS
jgi:DNA-binding PadR family transcriptional regulator